MTQPEQPKGFLAQIGNAIGAHVAPILERKLDEFSDKALAMIAEKLPEMAADIAERAVKTVFDNTQVDEAANQAIGVVTDFIEQFRRGLPFGLGR